MKLDLQSGGRNKFPNWDDSMGEINVKNE